MGATAGGLVPAAVGRLSTALRDDLSGLLKMVLGDKGPAGRWGGGDAGGPLSHPPP